MKRLALTRCLLLVVFLVGGSFLCLAQQGVRFSGKVLDSLAQTPTADVSIQVLSLPDSLVVAYSLTNPSGEFSLSVDRADLPALAVARFLGYSSTGYGIPASAPPSITHTFLLRETPLQLSEVAVKTVLPVNARGDTVSFNPAAFRDGSERNVEDLLKKMPGFRVSESGKISFNGKPVERVFLEGKDLFSKKYEFVTRSLSAGVLTKIEAIDNHAENPLLADIEKSGELVVNLSLDSTRRGRTFGQLEAGGGTPSRYEAGGSLFRLHGKYNAGIVAKANNLGMGIVDNILYELESDGRKTASVGDPTLVSSLQTLPIPYLDGVETRQYVFNNARLLALQQNYQASAKLSVKLTGYVSYDNVRWSEENSLRFLIKNEDIRFTDSLAYSNRPLVGALQVKVNYRYSPSVYASYIGDYKKSSIPSHSLLSTQNSALSESVSSLAAQTTPIQNHYFNFTKKLNDKQAFDAELSHVAARTPRTNETYSQRYALYFDLTETYPKIRQQENGHVSETRGTLRWKGKTSGGNFVLGGGYWQKTEGAVSSVSLSDSSGDNRRLDLDFAFTNDGRLQKQVLFVEGRYGGKALGLDWSAYALAQRAMATLHLENSSPRLSRHYFLFNPSLAVEKRIGRGKLTLSLSRTNALPTLVRQLDGYYLNNYRTFVRSIPNLTPLRTDKVAMGFGQANWPKLYLFSGGVTWSRSNLAPTAQNQVSDLISLQTNLLLPIDIDRWLAFAQAEKLIYPVSTKFRLETSVGVTRQFSKLNAPGLRNSLIQFSENKLYILSALNGPFNVETGVALLASKITSKQAGSVITNRNTMVRPHLNAICRTSQGMVFKIKASSYTWHTNGSKSPRTLLVDGQWNYTPQKSRWAYYLKAYNITNQHTFTQSEINDIAILQRVQFLQPRIIVAGGSLSF